MIICLTEQFHSLALTCSLSKYDTYKTRCISLCSLYSIDLSDTCFTSFVSMTYSVFMAHDLQWLFVMLLICQSMHLKLLALHSCDSLTQACGLLPFLGDPRLYPAILGCSMVVTYVSYYLFHVFHGWDLPFLGVLATLFFSAVTCDIFHVFYAFCLQLVFQACQLLFPGLWPDPFFMN